MFGAGVGKKDNWDESICIQDLSRPSENSFRVVIAYLLTQPLQILECVKTPYGNEEWIS